MAVNINVPSQVKTYANLAAFPATGALKTIYIAEDTNKTYRWTGSVYVEISASAAGAAAWGNITGTLSNQTDLQNALDAKQNTLVSGTNIKTLEGQSLLGSGNIDLTKSDVGLSNVDNTSDLNKPISTATQTALNAKQDTLTLTTTGTSGAATLVGATLNIPQYSGGGGGNGVHALVKPKSGQSSTTMVAPSTLGTLNVTQNRIYAIPFIPNNTFTTSSFYINVTNNQVGTNAKIMIYSNLDGQPDSLLYESTNLDCSTLGIKTATTAFTFNSGTTYWFCFWGSAIIGVSSIVIGNQSLIGFNGITVITSYIQTVTFGSAPNPFGTSTNNNGAYPFIGATI